MIYKTDVSSETLFGLLYLLAGHLIEFSEKSWGLICSGTVSLYWQNIIIIYVGRTVSIFLI